MAATFMTIEFGNIHHNSHRKIPNLVHANINWTLCKLWHFGLDNNVLDSNMNAN